MVIRYSPRKYEIEPISGFKSCSHWQINVPYLKLALKYGLIGPWRGENNPSIQFDNYCQTRGAKKDLPNLEDFRKTKLMNSNVDGKDENCLGKWLKSKYGLAQIKRIAAALDGIASLCELPDESLQTIAEITYGMIMDQESLKNIRIAKVYKWLAAWASEHIPMIDTELYFAFTNDQTMRNGKWVINYDSMTAVKLGSVLKDYKELLCSHHEQLIELGKCLAHECQLCLPVSPVRILDNLIWMDWYALRKYTEFKDGCWVEYQSKRQEARHHRILEQGFKFYENRGFARTVVTDSATR
jgi:hypothetical protein